MNATDRDAKMAALMLRTATRALQRAEAYATTDPEMKQLITDTRASVEHVTKTIRENVRLRTVAKVKPDVSNG